MNQIAENLAEVNRRIEESCRKVGRDVSEVTLIAVSKTKPLQMLEDAYEGGARAFGENHVQEILEKHGKLPADAEFHMIGHLQTNKVRQVIDKVVLIHSVDSLHLAERISKEAQKLDLTMDILLEVNVADEESKYGFKMEELENALRAIRALPNVRVRGLMTVAPFVDDPEENRPVFRRLHQFFIDTNLKNRDNIFDTLSMGMTGDYRVAIEEGATMVRVGTGIFGARNYAH